MLTTEKPRQGALCKTSDTQREIWLTAQLGEKASCACNESVALRLRGRLNTQALRAALQKLATRHERLQMSVSGDGRELRLRSELCSLSPELVDCAGLESASDQIDQELCRRESAKSFDLLNGPLARTVLARVADSEHLLVITCHQIVGNREFLEALVQELGEVYARLADADYQDERTANSTPALTAGSSRSQAEQQSLQYWLKRLASAPDFLEFPLDKPRPVFKTFAASHCEFPLPQDFVSRIEAFATAASTSLESAWLAAFAAFGSRVTGAGRMLLGVPAPHTGARLPLCVDVSDDPAFAQLLTQVDAGIRDAGKHCHLVFEQLLKAMNFERDFSRPPLVSNVVRVERDQLRWEVGDLAAETVAARKAFQIPDMEWTLRIGGAGARLECAFNRDLWEPETIAFRLAELATLMDAAFWCSELPLSRLAIIPHAERRFLARAGAGPERSTKVRHLTGLLDLQRYGDRPAVACAGESIDYRELDRRSSQLANYLLSVGVGHNDLVGVFVERSVNMLVSLLATWKAGAAYVALDPGYPAERLLYMAQAARLKAMITEADLDKGLSGYECPRVYLDENAAAIAEQSEQSPTVHGSPGDTAYVIFTSGSTGQPKGVQITHGGVTNFLLAMAERPGLAADDRFLAVTTLSFDIAVIELCLPLLVGGRVIIAEREEALDGYRLLELIDKYRVNVMQATPTTWRWMLAAGWEGQRDFKALCGGEAFPLDLARQLTPCVGEVWNMYGPTETTVWSTCHRLSEKDLAGGAIPVGTPIHNTQCHVLDEQQRPVPVGVAGELFIGGDGVANGYLGMPERTAERFVVNPFGPGRLYRTGDQVRLRGDGAFECLGRLDSQIKLRGYRIELGEIEAALARHPEVIECAASVVSYGKSDMRLVVYARVSDGSQLNGTQMRRFLRGFLPDYMVPQLFVQVDALPLTPNGKVDRKRLPSPDPAQLPEEANALVQPRNDTERELVRIWSELLKKDHEGINQLFFDVGGHSLLAMDMIAKIERRFGVRIHVLDVLVGTIEQLAAKVDAARVHETQADAKDVTAKKTAERERPDRPRGLLGRLFRRERAQKIGG
jgi:amino acid adenylation domain-containing protein